VLSHSVESSQNANPIAARTLHWVSCGIVEREPPCTAGTTFFARVTNVMDLPPYDDSTEFRATAGGGDTMRTRAEYRVARFDLAGSAGKRGDRTLVRRSELDEPSAHEDAAKVRYGRKMNGLAR
jgi:hypothetical protein